MENIGEKMQKHFNEKVVLNKYYYDFLEYYKKAKKVQEDCNLGGKPYIGSCGDSLIENVHIYDTVERKHAGFQNMLQDLWYGEDAPKYYKWTPEHKRRNISYTLRGLRNRWDRETWLWVFMLHRITGSGASFENDHGYRNTILVDLAKFDNIDGMVDYLRRNIDIVMFTSIGNQIPMFPKKEQWDSLNNTNFIYPTAGKLWICECMKELCQDIWKFIDYTIDSENRSVNIREIVDFMCEWNRSRGMKRFHFQFTATAADLADYYPEYVEEYSHMYYGKNAKEAMDLFGKKIGRYKKDLYYDIIMEQANYDTGGKPLDLEDVMCDYIRWVENYIPDNKLGTYSHLDKKKIWNSSFIVDHPKGRQRWKIGTDKWRW